MASLTEASSTGPAPPSEPSDGFTTRKNGRPSAPSRKRSSSSATSLLFKLPFIRVSGERPRSSRPSIDENEAPTIAQDSTSTAPSPTVSFSPVINGRSAAAATRSPSTSGSARLPSISIAGVFQQQKSRRRRGSLRKVALLGRNALRERRDPRASRLDPKPGMDGGNGSADINGAGSNHQESPSGGFGVPEQGVTVTASPGGLLLGAADTRGLPSLVLKDTAHALGIADLTPRPSRDDYGSRSAAVPKQGCGCGQNGARNSAADTTPTPSSVSTFPLQHTLSQAASAAASAQPNSSHNSVDSTFTSPSISYSTTDDEDGIQMPELHPRPLSVTSIASSSFPLPRTHRASSGAESYYPTLPHAPAYGRTLSTSNISITANSMLTGPIGSFPFIRRRSAICEQRAKSPLALTSHVPGGVAVGVAAGPVVDHRLHSHESPGWDYSETEFWGWVVLAVTWLVFVTGMGSCLGVWSWAWDVGITPSAPPELSDDDTLPIVGYYPALIILTCVMAWVWVVVAWVGMKYFRHARVNGD